MKREIAIAATVVCALTLAACGGDDSSQTSSPSEWADTLCTDLGQWRSSLQETASSFKGDLSKENAQDAANAVGDATETLVGQIKDLGRPDTQDGQQAQDEVNNLSDELETGSNEIQRAADDVSSAADVPQAAASITATATRLRTEVTSTLTNLSQLAPGSELQSAVEQSSACNDLKSS